MAIVASLLAVAFIAICFISYNQSVAEVYRSLEAAIMRDGGPHGLSNGMGGRFEDAAFISFELGGSDRQDALVPVAVYELVQNGSLTLVSNKGAAAISESLLASAASAVAEAPDGTGSLDDLGLLYAKRTMKGKSLVAFADAASASSWKSLVVVLVIVGAAALAVFFAVSLAFSKWALSPVREAWVRQKRFVSDASHELKTPLAVMAANTSILQRNAESTIASQSQWIESTETEIATMRELVDDMLFMASTDEGARSEPFEPVDLSRLVEAQLLQFESLAFEKGIDFASDVEDGIMIEGASAQLDRLVRTLLDNACKYTPEGGEVAVGLVRASDGHPVLTVANTGDVIPPDELPHLFDRFYRSDVSRNRAAGGYGLGLSIAHDIAEAHGATLTVASSVDAGTVFTVTWGS